MLKNKSIDRAVQKLSSGYTDRHTDKGKTFAYPHTRAVTSLMYEFGTKLLQIINY